MAKKNALLMIDLQKDFCEGGSLAVPDGDEVVPMANQLQPYFDLIIATKDWHPADHTSFASQHPGGGIGEEIEIKGLKQVLWPDHCVQDSLGSNFHPALQTDRIHQIFYKGTDKNIDSYSAFFDNAHLRSTGLGDYLRAQQIENIYIMGLATDYCVKYSALDAVHLKFHVFVITDACRGVELQPGNMAKALDEMKAAGAKLVNAKDIIKTM